MKKVLILAYDFPPYVSVGGLRPYNWYRYFAEFGVEPIVVTRQWENKYGNQLDYIAAGESNETIVEEDEFGTIIRTPYHPNFANRLMLKHGENKYRLLRRAASGYYEFTQFIYPTGPKAGLYKGARDYLKKNKVDAIIATGDPFVLFSYAAKLSKEFEIPWIADYRDPWSHNSELQKLSLQKRWAQYLEKKTVSSASHITTVSSFVQKKIERLISDIPFSVLPNGYDPDVIESISHIQQQNETLSIAFVGTIYNWHPIESFLRITEEFVKNTANCKLKLNFYGTNIPDELSVLVNERYVALIDHVNITPKMPNLELLEKLAEDNVMLLFNYYSYMGTKIFDYLGIKRKIILCYSDDAEANDLKTKYYNIKELASESTQLQVDLIKETNSGIIVKDAAHLSEVLKDLYEEFETKRFIACDSIGSENYSRKIQVAKRADIIKQISEKYHSGDV